MDFYIATKLDNDAAHNRLRDQLVALGHKITYDWTVHGPAFSKGLDEVRRVAKAETQGVMRADFVVMLWPGGRGTHVELGMGLALGKLCYIITPVEEHHQAHKETCAFYHYPCAVLCHTVEEFLAKLEVDVASHASRAGATFEGEGESLGEATGRVVRATIESQKPPFAARVTTGSPDHGWESRR